METTKNIIRFPVSRLSGELDRLTEGGLRFRYAADALADTEGVELVALMVSWMFRRYAEEERDPARSAAIEGFAEDVLKAAAKLRDAVTTPKPKGGA